MAFFDRFRKRKSPTKKGDGNEHVTRHCFVLSRTEEPGDMSQAASVVAEIFGDGYTADVSDANLITIARGDESVGFLAYLPAPIPGGEAEENADRNFLWPQGREEAAEHRSHVIVTNICAGEQTAIQSALAVSRLALVALKLFDGVGVYWGNASVSNSREVFEDLCENMSEEHVPVPVWLRFQLTRPADGELGLYTVGMRQFQLMDLEVDRCTMKARELFEFVSNVAHYLIQSGPVIADGNTVGGSEEERIVVRHRPSMIDDDKLVYKIVFGE